MSVTQQINSIIEQMPEKNQILILELLRAMISPDDIATADDIAAHNTAVDEYRSGETISHTAINWG